VLVLPLKDLDGRPTPSTLVFGQVVGAHIAAAFLKGGLSDLVAAGTIARCGYRGDGTQATSLFEMLRPTAGEAAPARTTTTCARRVSSASAIRRTTWSAWPRASPACGRG
jgi:hypothetical protein